MSADALPITAQQFALAIRELSLSSLHLKVLEIRNEIAHLEYSNEQLKPYAEGTVTAVGSAVENTPDQDCIDAIRENEAVITRKLEHLLLVQMEVQRRGCSWAEFQSAEEVDAAERERVAAQTTAALAVAQTARTNGTADEADTPGANTAAPPTATASTTNGTSLPRPVGGDPWSDGTFQTGTIRNGELHMDAPGSRPFGGAGASAAAAAASSGAGAAGGSLSDEQLRRALEERLRVDLGRSNGQTNGRDDDDDEEGMHL